MPSKRRPRPVIRPKFHHTTLATLRLDEMVEFYDLIAGLEPVYYGPGQGAWLTNDEANHRIALLALPELRQPEDEGHTTGLHHIAFEYDDFAQWIDNYVRLRDEQIVPFLNLDHGMTMSMYYQDPEGNGVEIQVDGFGDWACGKEWMWASGAFGDDPIGVHFEPERVLEAYLSGTPWQEIHRRARAGEYEPAIKPDVHLARLW